MNVLVLGNIIKLFNNNNILPVQVSIPAAPKYILPKRIRYHHLTESDVVYPAGEHQPSRTDWDGNLDCMSDDLVMARMVAAAFADLAWKIWAGTLSVPVQRLGHDDANVRLA